MVNKNNMRPKSSFPNPEYKNPQTSPHNLRRSLIQPITNKFNKYSKISSRSRKFQHTTSSPPPPPLTVFSGMKCRLHSSDLTSAVGVCATCLRERLFLLISAQSQTHQLQEIYASESDIRRNSDPHHTPLAFPRSVSPYVSRSKFDEVRLDFSDQRLFHSTPQIGAPIKESVKKKKSKFSFITSFFKSRSDKSESDQRTASNSSPLWRPAENKSKSVPKIVGRRNSIQNHRVSDRGMSPERSSYDGEEESSSPSCESYEPTWKQTPISSVPTTRRRHSNMSGLAFCLSPLVRASPSRDWNRKTNSLPAESGEGGAASRKAARLAVANSFCKNRSKKMADFGRGGFDHRR